MKTLNIYIFRKVLYSCFLSVAMFTLILLLGRAVKDVVLLLALGYLNWFEFFELLATLVPFVISYALPLGMLTGILLVLGKLSAKNEITAMRCAGISIWRISTPIFALAVMGVFGSVMINNYYAPNAKAAFDVRRLDSVRKDPMRLIVANTFIREFPGRVIFIGEETESGLEDFWIWQLDKNRNVHQMVRARTGEFSYDEEQDALILDLFDGYAENRDRDDPDGLDKPLIAPVFAKARIRLPLDAFFGKKTYSRKISSLNFNDLLDERTRTLSRNDLDPDEKKTQVIRVQSQVQKNFAMAFSVLAFTFLAIPLGIKVGRGENYANLLVALGLAFVWYFAFVIVGWLEKNPVLRPDILIWLPNIGFQILGLYLFLRVSGR